MRQSFSRWLATVMLVVGSVGSSLSAQVTLSLNDDDSSAPDATFVSEFQPSASASASDLASQPATESSIADEAFSYDNGAYVPRNWLTADSLVWWTKGNQLPSLVTTSPAGTARAAAGVLPGATTLFGAGQIDNEYRFGLRLTFGHWADPDGTIGWQAQWFSVFDDDNTGDYSNGTTGALGGGTGTPILARPFFNTSLAREDALIASFPAVADAQIFVDSSSEMHSGSFLLRQHWRSGSRGRIDLLGGYRYFRFREGLNIRESIVSTDPGSPLPVGTTLYLEDNFLADNNFHGGDLGFVAEFWRDWWTVEVLAKVALGNLHRSASVSGQTITDVPPAGGAVTTNGGLLALPTNSGQRSANEFAALPEINLNLRFEPRDDLSILIGYSILALNDVNRTGALIDRNINPTQLSGGALVGTANPATNFNSVDDFWVQGLNFGVTFSR